MNLKLRQQVLKILLHEFGDTASSKSIYECADDWCSKQVTANGIVSYFKAYYTKQQVIILYYIILNDKNAAKKLLKRAKKHPDWYTEKDVYYAKMIKKRFKKNESKTDSSDTKS